MARGRVVIVGGGFAGVAAARGLATADVDVTLVDRNNHHLFQPLLYQVATAALSPSDVAEPIRSMLANQQNTSVRLGEVVGVDLDARHVCLNDGEALPYDWLVLAAGARHAYFGHAEWETHAPGLKTVGDALEIRRRVLLAFERAEWTDDPTERRRCTTFVVVGAGPTGVELAGALADISRRTLARDFRRVDTRQARIVLVEGSDDVLGAFPEPLRVRARQQLELLGVEVRSGEAVTDVDASGVRIGDERIEAATVLWAAGVEASPLGRGLGARIDRAGRVEVAPDLSVPGQPDVFVIGDQARVDGVPGVAPAALQMGAHVARQVRADLEARPRAEFRYVDHGALATVGRSRAVARVGWLRLSGAVAWLLWVFVHLMTLVTFRSRVVVFVKWAWAWATFDQSSRVVWGSEITDPRRAGVQPPGPATA